MATPAGARSLPPLTRIALHSDYKRLGRIAVRLLGGSLMAAVALGSAALVLMPPLIAALFGSSVRPSPVIAALTVSGTVLAIGNLGLNQILVAAARTHWITTAWWVALAGALAWVMTAPGDVLHRVSTGFVLGELIALLALALASNLGLKPATKGARLARLSASAFMPARASSGVMRWSTRQPARWSTCPNRTACSRPFATCGGSGSIPITSL